MAGLTHHDPNQAIFEKIWATLRETAEMQKKGEKEIKKIHRIMKKAAEDLEKWKEENKKSKKELDRKMGGLTNSFGDVIEHLVAPGILEKFNDMGFGLNKVSENRKIAEKRGGRLIMEIDIFLESKDAVIAVSVKAKGKPDHIDEHVKQMDLLRELADSEGDKRRYFGAVAFAITSESLREAIWEKGFYAVEQAGDTMKIVAPDGFQPRQW